MTPQQPGGLLTAWMNISPEHEDEFNRWYNTEHIQERVGISGFLNGRRYLSLEGEPKYFALYEMESPNVVYEDAYKRARQNPTPWSQRIESLFQDFVRNIYEEIFSDGQSSQQGSPYVLTVRLDVSPEKEEEFNAWYNEDHIPALIQVEGVHGAKRYRTVEGAPKYLAVYQLANPELLKSDAWAKARDYGRTQLIWPYLQDLKRNVGKLLFQLNN